MPPSAGVLKRTHIQMAIDEHEKFKKSLEAVDTILTNIASQPTVITAPILRRFAKHWTDSSKP